MKKQKSRKYNVESKIRSALRKIWLYSPQRKEALNKAKVRGMPLYICAHCKKTRLKEQVHVDHILACGVSAMGNFDVFISRLFEGELQVLCVDCHEVKSKLDKKAMQ